jgi:hypothetical protein
MCYFLLLSYNKYFISSLIFSIKKYTYISEVYFEVLCVKKILHTSFELVEVAKHTARIGYLKKD